MSNTYLDSTKTNLLQFDLAGLTAWCESIGEKPFRAKQLMKWLHQNRCNDFNLMTDLAKTFREKLQTIACIVAPEIEQTFLSKDGTVKWLVKVDDKNRVEMVYIPEDDRGTLCISSQAGCAVNCKFCSTGKQGFSRNLRSDEIIGQLWLAEKLLEEMPHAKKMANERGYITNVVMMGMGEPLLNYEPVKIALSIMLDDFAYNLSRRRVTLSTSGVVPFIDKLAKEMPVALAVSLHAPNNELRDVLVPLNKKYTIEVLFEAIKNYLPTAPRDFVTFEYCMLDGINDTDFHAKQLVQLIVEHRLNCKLNLIPFNPFPESGLKVSKPQQVRNFSKILTESGLITTTRKTRGDDIDAACGQLAGDVQDRTNLEARSHKINPENTLTEQTISFIKQS